MNLTTFTQTKPAVIAALLPLVKAHLRVETADEDALIGQYIAGAIGIAENYLDRDVWPTARAYSGPLDASTGVRSTTLLSAVPAGFQFDFRRGRASAVEFKSGGTTVTPDELIASADPKTWGFIAYFASDPGVLALTLTSGFADLAAMPEDLTQFILAACGMLYEVREMGNYGAAYPVDWYPTHLLGAWANPTIA
jgi:hypothetical protein